MQMASLCSTGRVASIEVHIDIFRPPSDPKLTRPEVTWGQNLTDLPGLTNACFAASWQKKHTEVRIISLAFFVQKLSTKTILLFEVNDLTSKLNRRPKVFPMYTIGFVPSRASCSFFPRISGSIMDWTAGIPTDPCPRLPPPPRHVGRCEKPFTGEVQMPRAWLFNCVFMSKIDATS